jgi:hypothetical protein
MYDLRATYQPIMGTEYFIEQFEEGLYEICHGNYGPSLYAIRTGCPIELERRVNTFVRNSIGLYYKEKDNNR